MNQNHRTHSPSTSSLSTPRPVHEAGAAPRPGTLITAQDYVEHYIQEGRRLLQRGVEPACPVEAYVAAYPHLTTFLRQHGDVLAERGVVSAEIAAGNTLLQRLSDLGGPEPAPPGETALHLAGPACERLLQLRESARRVLRTDGELRAHFGLWLPVRDGDPVSVVHGIDLFLLGAERHQELWPALRLLPQDLQDLEAHGRRLAAALPEVPPIRPAQTEALLSLDALFASLGTAIAMAFPKGDPRRGAGLRHLPRGGDRRRGVRARLWKQPSMLDE